MQEHTEIAPEWQAPEPEEACRIAQNLARNCGWHVFPCRGDKRPATHNGFHDATNEPDEIAELWSRFPGPLIGLATGEASGVDILDLDAKHDEARAWWFQNRERLPATRRYRTRSGGMHAFFRSHPAMRCTAGKIALGVDTRGIGGYAIFWFGAGLDCLEHSPPAPWPAWLLDQLREKPKAPPSTFRAAPTERNDKALDGLVRVVREAREGTRNAVLFWACNRMRESGATGADAWRDLAPAAREAGLDDIEIKKTIDSAWD